MPQTLITAGDAVGGVTALQGGNDGTLSLVVGPAGSKVTGFSLAADGTPSFLKARGGIAQIVSAPNSAFATGTTLIPLDDTIPQITEGDQYMTATITPINAASTLEVNVIIYASNQSSGQLIAALFRDSTANALSAGVTYSNYASTDAVVNLTVLVSAGSTASTTFRVRAGGSAAGSTTYFNGTNALTTRVFGGVCGSSITIKEYLP